MIVKVLLGIVVLYVLLGAAIFFFQRTLLYPADTRPPTAAALDAAGLTPWPAGAAEYRGLIGAPPVGTPAGTVVVFHGNAGRAADRDYYRAMLEPLGYRVLLAEYPGYGGREGDPSEATLTADAKATVELAYAEFGPPLILWGESLGAGVAAAVAADAPVPIEALALITPWDSLPALAQSIYRFYPARQLVLDKYDSVANLQGYAGRIAVVLAEQDTIVPVRHGLTLYESITGEKQLWTLEGVGHNTWPLAGDWSWLEEVAAFMTPPVQNE